MDKEALQRQGQCYHKICTLPFVSGSAVIVAAALGWQRVPCVGSGCTSKEWAVERMAGSATLTTTMNNMTSHRNRWNNTNKNTCFFASPPSATQKTTKGDRQGMLKVIQHALTIAKYKLDPQTLLGINC
jgi:hypothetical protein